MSPALGAAPAAFAAMVAAAHLARQGLTEVVVTGERPDLLGVVQSAYLPTVVLAWGEPYDSPLWEGRSDPSSGLAYVCRQYTCLAPTGDRTVLEKELAGIHLSR